jgi:bifunctional non-homologous end joining protein LigD
MEIERTALEYRKGSSDKIYIASIRKYDNGHQVVFEYGKRYNIIGRSIKPSKPVTYPEARSIYDEMIHKKLKKGYVLQS